MPSVLDLSSIMTRNMENSSVLYERFISNCSDNSFGPASCERDFDLTLLFEQSILSIAPSALLLLGILLRLFQLYLRDTKTLPDPIHGAKIVATTIYAGLQVTILALWTANPQSQTRASVPSAALDVVGALGLILLTHYEHTKSIRPSPLITSYFLLSIIFDAAQARTLFLSQGHSALPAVLASETAMKTVLLWLEVQTKRSYLKPYYRRYPNEATSGVISWSTMWWLNGLFCVGFRKLMTYDDIDSLDDDLKSANIGPKMIDAWNKRSKPESKRTLPLATLYCLRWQLLSAVIPRACLIGFNYCQPFLITRAVDLLDEPNTQLNKSIGYGLIGATLLIYLGIAISTVHYQHRWFRCITMFRGGLIALIYEKTLNIQDGVYNDSAAITLMSTDIDSMIDGLQMINEIWARTIEVILGIWLLARQLGAVSVAPIILVLACTALQTPFSRYIQQRMKVWNESIQRRVAVTSSMLSSMKAVKMMGLQTTLEKTIQNLRLIEIVNAKRFYLFMISVNLFAVIPYYLSPMITFIIYAIKAKVTGSEPLSAVQALTSLAIIGLLSRPAAFLIYTISQVPSATACFGRIQAYLVSAEREEQRLQQGDSRLRISERREVSAEGIEMVTVQPNKNSKANDNLAIAVENATIRPAAGIGPVLHNISFNIPQSSLTILFGPVGCGKSTLMKAILGELPCGLGSITVASRNMAYCRQTTWLLNTSIQQNICGLSRGDAIDEVWYETVMKACALNQDMQMLPDGDRSVIGSKGLTLSGGQKQRLALARAVYTRQPIILLDDILSALDTKTAELVVDRLLGKNGLLKRLGTTMVLITHSTRYLPVADQIIVLNANGTISQQGSYSSLKSEPGFIRDTLDISSDREVIPETNLEYHGVETDSVEKTVAKPSAAAAMDLTRRTGDITVYRYYAKTVGKLLGFCFLGGEIVLVFTRYFPIYWLARWTSASGNSLPFYVTIYAIISTGSVVFSWCEMWISTNRIMPKSAAKLHEILLKTTMSARQSYFASTDTGEILNRFSQDMTLIDNRLPTALSLTISEGLGCLAQAALISTGSSYMAITIPFMLLVLYVLQNIYLKTSRQLRFMDLEAKSPLYSHFLETLDGLSTIRAFGRESAARDENTSRLDASQKPYYMLFCIQRWLNLVLDLLVCAMAVIVVALAVSLRGTTSAALLGVALNNVLGFTFSLSGFVTQWTQLETSIGAIARVKNFERTTVSEDGEGEDQIPPPRWPERGEIEFRDVQAKYNENGLALDGINLRVKPGEKVGVCGRTGSGKSSLLMTLLRLLDMSAGTILIDGLDISTMPRATVRSRIITIPQDPFLLQGSIRLNADPSGSATDDLIVGALIRIGLWDMLQGRGGLEADLMEQPLSQGQQQLFCLARALVKNEIARENGEGELKILVLDEATSSVDQETDSLMQRILREAFGECTIVVVAHRIDTIMDSDKIVVLDAGRVAEFDSPTNLLSRNSMFKQLNGC